MTFCASTIFSFGKIEVIIASIITSFAGLRGLILLENFIFYPICIISCLFVLFTSDKTVGMLGNDTLKIEDVFTYTFPLATFKTCPSIVILPEIKLSNEFQHCSTVFWQFLLISLANSEPTLSFIPFGFSVVFGPTHPLISKETTITRNIILLTLRLYG